MTQARMQSMEQLFVYELQEMLAAEQEVASALDGLSRCQSNGQLQQTFGTHLTETQNQIDRLDQVFATVGQQAVPATCEGMAGIVREHERFVAENQPAPQVHAAFDAGVGQKVEQYEITAYQQLVKLSTQLGYQQAAGLLQSNLAEERRQLQRLQGISNAMDVSRPPAQAQPTGQGQRQAPQRRQTGGRLQQQVTQ